MTFPVSVGATEPWTTVGAVARVFLATQALLFFQPLHKMVYGVDYGLYTQTSALLSEWDVVHPGEYILVVVVTEAAPRPTTLFNIREMPPAAWAWVVEARRRVSFLDGTVVWGDYHHNNVWLEPYGFGDRASAVRRMEEVTLLDPEVTAGTTEYRVSPKYIGYKPDGESWYRVTYPSLSDSTK